MSGIAGVLAFNDGLETTQLAHRLVTAMSHRGPQGVAQWNSANVSLGQCLTPNVRRAARTTLPLVCADPPLALVMDGRIDNRQELIDRLKPRFEFSTASDPAYVMEAYKKWGRDCPAHLLGDFAFGIWDQANQLLFCARDPIGARPLCYALRPGFFAFASEPEALLTLPTVSSAPNEEEIASLLVPEFENHGDRRTWNRDVIAVLEGESISIGANGTLSVRRYWEAGSMVEHSYRSDEDAAEHFTTVFRTAVADRMSTAGDSAMMLSGGLDSAGIATMASCLAQKSPNPQLHAYSAVDEDSGNCEESCSIMKMGSHLGMIHHLVQVPSFQGMVDVSDLIDAAWNHAHPVDNTLLLPAMMALAASRDGHRLVMHGVSGDLAMHAPLYYPAEWIRKGRVITAWKECSRASQDHVYLQGFSPVTIFRRSLAVAGIPRALRSQLVRLRHGTDPSPINASNINPDFATHLHLRERLEEQDSSERSAVRSLGAELSQFRKNLGAIRSGLAAFGRVAGRFGVEVNDPWADRRVLEFFYRLPISYRVQNGWTKYLLRIVLQSHLPSEIVWRRDKNHLGWKFAARLMMEMNNQVRELLLDDTDYLRQYADVDKVRKLFSGLSAQPDVDQQDKLFGYVTLILWLKRLRTAH